MSALPPDERTSASLTSVPVSLLASERASPASDARRRASTQSNSDQLTSPAQHRNERVSQANDAARRALGTQRWA